MKTIQFFLTPAAGKALIAKALMERKEVRDALMERTVVIVAGTTNTYVAREALRLIGEELGEVGFYRGIVKPPKAKPSLPMLEGDVVIRKGVWLKGRTIVDTAGELADGDVICKGANAVYLPTGEAGVLIGNPAYGTMAPISTAVMGRRVKLIIPVGVEKRVEQPIYQLMRQCNAPDGKGLRMSIAPGDAYTELDAIRQMGGVNPTLVASGGVCGYEGGCYFCCGGVDAQLEAIQRAVDGVSDEPAFAL